MRELEVLARQTGLITRRQALDSGVSSSAVGRKLDTGEWTAVLPGVYRHVASAVTDQVRVHAAVLWLGPDAVLWGCWAAWWHGLRAEPEGPVSITVGRSARSRSHPSVKIRRRDLAERDVMVLHGVRVTTRPLTAQENAHLPGGQSTFDRALQKRVEVPDLSRAMDRLFHADGAAAARTSLEAATDGTVSHPERLLAAALRSAGLTAVKAGAEVIVHGRLFWLDFSVEALELVIEVDGWRAHSDPQTFETDRARQNALALDRWLVLRFTARQISQDIDRVVREIRQAIQGFRGDCSRDPGTFTPKTNSPTLSPSCSATISGSAVSSRCRASRSAR